MRKYKFSPVSIAVMFSTSIFLKYRPLYIFEKSSDSSFVQFGALVPSYPIGFTSLHHDFVVFVFLN